MRDQIEAWCVLLTHFGGTIRTRYTICFNTIAIATPTTRRRSAVRSTHAHTRVVRQFVQTAQCGQRFRWIGNVGGGIGDSVVLEQYIVVVSIVDCTGIVLPCGWISFPIVNFTVLVGVGTGAGIAIRVQHSAGPLVIRTLKLVRLGCQTRTRHVGRQATTIAHGAETVALQILCGILFPIGVPFLARALEHRWQRWQGWRSRRFRGTPTPGATATLIRLLLLPLVAGDDHRDGDDDRYQNGRH